MDGSGAGVSTPSKGRGRPHIFPRLAACNPSKSDGSGRPKAATAIPSTCRNAKSRRLVCASCLACASLEKLLHFFFQLRERSDHGALARVDNDFPPGADPIEAHTDRFPNSPLDPVANHSSPQGARTGETDLDAFLSIISQAERGKQRPGKLGAMIVDSPEILGAQDSSALGKAGRACYLSSLTVSFFRPRARRRANTARPFLVDILVRKPCVLARCLLFG